MTGFDRPPTPDEIADMERRAEEMMTPEQAAMSEERERFRLQERDPFDSFLAHIDGKDERRAPTPEEREKMDRQLEILGDLFADSGVRWQLDGALNISLYAGDYIGVHKDVDVSVYADDLEDLDAHMARSGYGLFLSYAKDPGDPDGKKIMERVGATKFAGEGGHNTLAAIDERGQMRTEAELSIIDTHVVAQEAADAPFRPGSPFIPKEWFEPVPVEFHGRTINLSHPAKVAYFKLTTGRAYDRTDLKRLAETGRLKAEDVDVIVGVLEDVFKAQIDRSDGFIGDIAAALRPGMTAEEAFAAMAEVPVIKQKLGEADAVGKLRAVAEELSAGGDFSPENVKTVLFRTFEIRREHDRRLAEAKGLRSWIEEEGLRKRIKDEDL